MIDEVSRVVGVVLAGGRARRMGGRDKSFVLLNDRPLLQRAIVRFTPQVGSLVVSANGPREHYAKFQTPVVADTLGEFAGPLAGMLAGMRWARANAPDASRIATVAVDTPFFPLDLVARLSAACGSGGVAAATSRGHIHPVFSLMPLGLADDLAAFLAAGTSFSVSNWLDRHNAVHVDFDEVSGVDPFFNVNTPADLAQAEDIAASCASL